MQSIDGVILNVNDKIAVEEARFAVQELSKLSDSRIYTTLTLDKIISAEQKDGIFHDNVVLQLELASPYFKSGKPTEKYEMIVMTHKEDKVKTLAIDEFPVMNEDAIERFWIEKVEEKRIQREKSFRKLELEALYASDLDNIDNADNIDIKLALDKLNSQDFVSDLRTTQSLDILSRLPEALHPEEAALASLSLNELFDITVSARRATDFQKHRAQQIIDSVFRESYVR